MKKKLLQIISLILISATLTACAGENISSTGSVNETSAAETSAETSAETTPETTEATAEATTPATVPAEATTPKPSDTTTTKPSETETDTTTTTTTTAATPQSTETSAPEWTETAVSGTKYVTVDCYSRAKAIVGSERVKLYKTNTEVKVVARNNTGYFKLSDGSFIHGDYLSDSKIVIQTTTTTKKAETPKPATTTTKKQESKPKSIYEYPFDLEAIRQVIIDDAINNYGLVLAEDSTPDDSSWNAPGVISKDIPEKVIKRNVESCAGANFKVAQMKKGDYFNVYIETIPDLKKDENGNSIEGYAIYFLRGGPSRQ